MNMQNLASSDNPDTEISREDQLKINQFSKLNMKYHETKESIKKIKEELENLEEAAETIEEAMGDPLKLFVGECLVEVDEEAATQYQERVTGEKQEELE